MSMESKENRLETIYRNARKSPTAEPMTISTPCGVRFGVSMPSGRIPRIPKVETIKKATNPDDIYTILLSPKIIKTIGKILGEIHGLKISDDIIVDIIINEIGSGKKLEANKILLKKLGASEQKPRRRTKEEESSPESEPEETAAETTESDDEPQVES